MIKPAAPWFAVGLLLVLVERATVWLPTPSMLPYLAGLAGVALLSVGVYRLVQHADRAAGCRPPIGRGEVGITPEERTRQAAAREALVRENE
ncbi:hypothetical protein [uncultured Cellulomonas sp.]|uniref:hypothetical protein n=1 Tax=uncultured Cellulomonas sp. TaxID=189682 RepID=UPI0028E532E7|nr:hypothetical protein [uncultured Cellulomonas sp.]